MNPTRTLTHPRRLSAALVIAATLSLAALGGLAAAQTTAPLPGIQVTGTGVVHGEPDQATLDLGVTAVSGDVREAMAEVDAVMAAVRDAVVEAGIDPLDVRTTGFSVWREQPIDRDGNPGAERFHVRHAYQVVVRDIGSLGEVLAAAVAAGANDVGGIQFSVADPSALASAARQLAMEDARARAAELATLGGVTLGAPVLISEPAVGGFAPQAARVAFDAGIGGASIETGQLAVTVQVQVTFGIE